MSQRHPVLFRLHDQSISVELEPQESLLEAALRVGLNPNYSCMQGACCACVAKIIQGKVKFSSDTALDPEAEARGFVLTCQTEVDPEGSDVVIVDFNQSPS